jgi:hypothetical protein
MRETPGGYQSNASSDIDGRMAHPAIVSVGKMGLPVFCGGKLTKKTKTGRNREGEKIRK